MKDRTSTWLTLVRTGTELTNSKFSVRLRFHTLAFLGHSVVWVLAIAYGASLEHTEHLCSDMDMTDPLGRDGKRTYLIASVQQVAAGFPSNLTSTRLQSNLSRWCVFTDPSHLRTLLCSPPCLTIKSCAWWAVVWGSLTSWASHPPHTNFSEQRRYGTQRNQIPLNIYKDVLRPNFFPHGENSLPATCKHCSADDTEE